MFAKPGATLAEARSAQESAQGPLRLEFTCRKHSVRVLMHISPLLGDHFPLLLPLGAFCFVLFCLEGHTICHQETKMARIECVTANYAGQLFSGRVKQG